MVSVVPFTKNGTLFVRRECKILIPAMKHQSGQPIRRNNTNFLQRTYTAVMHVSFVSPPFTTEQRCFFRKAFFRKGDG